MESPTYLDAVENCRYCFMCRHAGTVFRTTKRDAHTARGRALQFSNVLSGRTEWDAQSIQRIYEDPIDGLCRQLCVFHWPEDDLVREARIGIVAANLEPDAVKNAMATATQTDPADWQPDAAHLACASRILYLGGWAARRHAVELVEAQLGVLDAGFGTLAVLDDETATAAAAAFDLGYVARAKELSDQLIDLVRAKDPERIVTGCSHTLRVLHGETGGTDISGQILVQHFSEAVEELVADGKLKLTKRADQTRVAIHDAEHLARSRQVAEIPRKVASLVLKHPLVEFEHNRDVAESAGAGAVLFATNPELTAAIAKTRLAQASELGIAHVVTTCPHCYIALKQQSGSGPLVEDLSQLVHRAAGL